MKKASFIPILGQTQFHNYSTVVSNLSKKLVFAFSVKGKNASSFGKELAKKVEEWQIESVEKLHQKILDLLQFCRNEDLEIELASSFLDQNKIIFACFSGQILLRRNGKTREILKSDKEISLILGNFKDEDQIVLLNRSASDISKEIIELLNIDVSQKKLISQITIKNSKSHNNNSIAFVEYQKEKKQRIKKRFNYQKFLKKSKKFTNNLLLFSKNTFKFLKKNFLIIKKMDRQKLKNRLFIIIFILISSFVLFSLKKKQGERILQETKVSIENILNKTKDIDQKIETEPLIARQISKNSLSELEELVKTSKNKESKKLIEEEIEKVKKLIEEISAENSLDKLSIAFDLSQKSSKFLGKTIKEHDGKLYVLENEGQEILKIEKTKTKIIIQSLKSENIIRDFTISQKNIYFLGNGIAYLEIDDLATEEDFDIDEINLKEEGESDKTGQFLNNFGPYIYLVNPNKRNIYRYHHNGDELSDPIGWLIDKEGISFDKISHFLVDGDIWLGFEDGKIMKFEKGKSLNFQVQGLEQKFENPILITSKEELNKIAILEKKNKRLVILSKDGQVFSKIKSNELAAVNDICFSADGQTIFAISGSVIYQIQI